MSRKLDALVAGALTSVRNPRVDNDVISAGMVQDLAIDEQGSVTLTFLLTQDDPGGLVREARKAVQQVEGVTEVKIEVVEPRSSEAARAAPPQGTAPVAAPAAPSEAVEIPALGSVIAVSSGKGGVGKSTVAANIAAELAREGHRVGIMDADIYGPNIPRLFGIDERPPVRDQRILPLEKYGVKLISLGFLVERDMPAIWRGPIVTKIIHQFLRDVEWGELDYFLVDLPPGTGDAQLSLAQAVFMKGGIIVTTPQEMATGDALRGAKMFERVGVPVLGVVENMSYFEHELLRVPPLRRAQRRVLGWRRAAPRRRAGSAAPGADSPAAGDDRGAGRGKARGRGAVRVPCGQGAGHDRKGRRRPGGWQEHLATRHNRLEGATGIRRSDAAAHHAPHRFRPQRQLRSRGKGRHPLSSSRSHADRHQP
jgi:ATP-binding protein involved in chromosome partitioning